jgi:WD40 repeat protein
MKTDAKELTARYTPKPAKVVQTTQQFCTARFSPCGKVLAAGSFEGQIVRWDASAEALPSLPPLSGHSGFVTALVFHPDQKRLFSADSWGHLRAWPYADAAAKPLWANATAHDGWIRQLALSPDGQRLASCGRDQKVRFWNVADGTKTGEFDAGDDVYAVCYTPDGKGLVSGDLKGVIKHWDLAAGKVARELDAKVLFKVDRLNEVGGTRCFCFDPAGTTLYVGGAMPKNGGFVEASPRLLAFDWATGKVKQTVELGGNNEGFLVDLHHHPDGFLFGVISGPPGQGRLFYLLPGDKEPFFKQPFANPHAVSLHPTNSRLVVCATNANSSGNGAVLDKDKQYAGNFSPLHVLEFAKK